MNLFIKKLVMLKYILLILVNLLLEKELICQKLVILLKKQFC